MASKTQQAKEAQGYQAKPRNCGNCSHRTCERSLDDWMKRTNAVQRREVYTLAQHGTDRNHRCGIGGFAIKKTASCAQWAATGTPT